MAAVESILIVDDDRDFAEVIRSIVVEELGLQAVVVASKGEIGDLVAASRAFDSMYSWYEAHRFDLALIDLSFSSADSEALESILQGPSDFAEQMSALGTIGGFALIRRITEWSTQQGRGVRCIGWTKYPEKVFGAAVLDAGAYWYLVKYDWPVLRLMKTRGEAGRFDTATHMTHADLVNPDYLKPHDLEPSQIFRRSACCNEIRRIVDGVNVERAEIEHDALLRRAEAERIRVESVQRFLRLVFHGVGNNLNHLKEGLEELVGCVAARSMPEPARFAELICDMAAAKDRLLGYLDRFRREGEKVHELAPVRVRDFCYSVVGDIVRGDKDIEEIIEVDKSHYVIASELLVAEALGNVVSNAVKALKRSEYGGGMLRVQVAESSEWVLINVDDSGPGVRDPDALFVAGRSSEGGGHGFGLSYARSAVELMNGHLRYDGPSVLGGARFVLELPKASPPTAE